MLRIFILISIDNWQVIFLCLWHGKNINIGGKNINIGIRGVRGRYYICQLKSQLGQQLMVATCYILLWASMTCIEWTLPGLQILHCATTCVCVCVEEILHVWETLLKKKTFDYVYQFYGSGQIYSIALLQNLVFKVAHK